MFTAKIVVSRQRKQSKTQQQQKHRDNADVDDDITMIIQFTETC